MPHNVITGDVDSGIMDLPEYVPPETEMKELQSMAGFKKSTEYQRIKEWCETKISMYQQYLPGNGIIPSVVVTTEDWRVADRVIKDLNELLSIYDSAETIVKDMQQNGE